MIFKLMSVAKQFKNKEYTNQLTQVQFRHTQWAQLNVSHDI